MPYHPAWCFGEVTSGAAVVLIFARCFLEGLLPPAAPATSAARGARTGGGGANVTAAFTAGASTDASTDASSPPRFVFGTSSGVGASGAGMGLNAAPAIPPAFSVASPGLPARLGVSTASPAFSNAACISSTRHSMSFFFCMTPALMVCWVASAATDTLAFSASAALSLLALSSWRSVDAIFCFRTPMSSLAAAIASVAAFCATSASNSRCLDSSRSASSRRLASTASSSAVVAASVVFANASFCARTAFIFASSAPHSSARCSPA